VKIPFIKAHGARNDFLLTWTSELPQALRSADREQLSIAICDRHTGVGADGWMLLDRAEGTDASIELWNSDGSRSEISGNGTRCAAALVAEPWPTDASRAKVVRIQTGAGPKRLRLLRRDGPRFFFEMNMGAPRIEQLESPILEGRDAVILNVGNPQCAVFVGDFDWDWRGAGAELERHERFPNRTNVSFVRVLDRHTLDVRFFERGAGETMSSGTGSTGAFAAAVASGLVESPVEVHTPAGPLQLRLEENEVLLAGPAELVARGEYLWHE
jgi:diaminopimelate epimerase